jgi:hypothetical protein
MNISRKQRKLQPWEILPPGSEINCYIYDVELSRKRVEITTYLPDEWDVCLPPKRRNDDDGKLYDNIFI